MEATTQYIVQGIFRPPLIMGIPFMAIWAFGSPQGQWVSPILFMPLVPIEILSWVFGTIYGAGFKLITHL